MSGLYAGITFSNTSAAPADTAAHARHATAVTAASLNDSGSAVSQTLAQSLDEANRYAAEQAEISAREAAEKEKRAALAFGPIRRKPVAKAKPATSASVTIVGAPSLYEAPSAAPVAGPSAAASTAGGLTGRTLIAPPSMTLDEDDVNGFKATSAGKKANKKRKGKKRKEDDPALAWTAEYDPSRPTDYNEYKLYSRIARTQRREALQRERERQRRIQAGHGGQSGSASEYSDSDDDSDTERRRRIAKANNRFFAPPTSYGDDKASESPAISVDITEGNHLSESQAADADESPVVLSEPQDDGWSAWFAAPVKDDDPYARRLALSSHSNVASSVKHPQTSSSNEAVSMLHERTQISAPTFEVPHSHQDDVKDYGSSSSSPAPPPVPSVFNPLIQSRQTGSTQQIAESAWQSPVTNLNPSTHHVQSHHNVFDHSVPSVSPTPPVPSAAGISVEEAQAKAKAIAARLAAFGKLGAPLPTSAPPSAPAYSMPPIPGLDEPIPGLDSPADSTPKVPSVAPENFAASMMAKYGWSKGQGLGATSQGMLNPLALSGPGGEGTSKKSKSSIQQAAQPNTKLAKVTGMSTVKGRIVSDLRADKERTEKEKYGEPTRIVCLSNIVGRDEVDDDVALDVGEEARKHGVLERCFVHMMPNWSAEDDSVRVFLVYSGLVGAWKAVKEFDGRYFGGRTVKARFYDEKAAIAGTLHL